LLLISLIILYIIVRIGRTWEYSNGNSYYTVLKLEHTLHTRETPNEGTSSPTCGDDSLESSAFPARVMILIQPSQMVESRTMQAQAKKTYNNSIANYLHLEPNGDAETDHHSNHLLAFSSPACSRINPPSTRIPCATQSFFATSSKDHLPLEILRSSPSTTSLAPSHPRPSSSSQSLSMSPKRYQSQSQRAMRCAARLRPRATLAPGRGGGGSKGRRPSIRA
jgi:hypothetical protein